MFFRASVSPSVISSRSFKANASACTALRLMMGNAVAQQQASFASSTSEGEPDQSIMRES